MWTLIVDRLCVCVCACCMTGASYDVITVGVFTALAFKYKHGGLRRLKHQLSLQRPLLPATDGSAPPLVGSTSPWSRLATITETLGRLNRLQEAVVEACDSLCSLAAAGDPSELQAAASLLTEQVG